MKESEVGPETSIAMVVGTLPYLAPEQILSQAISAATDTYALGIIAYEMLTGRLPFSPDAQDVRIAVEHLRSLQQAGTQLRPRDLRASLPEAAEAAILKAISLDPAERHQRAKDFGEELAQALTAAKADAPIKSPSPKRAATQKPEQAYVLFADIVEYSSQHILHQQKQIRQLNEIARSTSTYRQAKADSQMISLSRGDAVALAFFEDPMAAIECAVEIAKAVQAQSEINVRIGLHTEPVLRGEDTKVNQDIADSGINFAQRVMDCGDAGHVLLSKAYADFLLGMGNWTPHLQDLGEHSVKQAVRLHLYNFCNGDVGNPEVPSKICLASLPSANHNDVNKSPWEIVAIAAFLVILASVLAWKLGFSSNPEPPGANSARPVVEVIPPSARTLSYSVLVQTWRDNKPVGDGQEMFADLDSAIYFREDDRIRLNVTASQAGYIYLLNEGPQPANNGKPIYTVMFPSTADNDASALIKANQRKTIPRAQDPPIGFVGNKGAEKVWLIWSANPVDELEAVKQLNNTEDFGAIRDPSQIIGIQRFLSEHISSKLQGEKDEANRRTQLRFAGDLLVHLVKLEHR